MLIPTDKIFTTSFKDPKPNTLQLALGRHSTLFWVIPAPKGPVASFLSGQYAGHGFVISEGTDWTGVGIGPVEVRIAPSSAHDGRELPAWQLRAADGQLAVQVTMKGPHNFDETFWIDVQELETISNVTAYFSRWSIGLEVDGEWTELIAASEGQLSGSMLPQSQ